MNTRRSDWTQRILALFASCALTVGGLAWAEDQGKDKDKSKESKRWEECEVPRTVIKKLRYMNPEKVPGVLSVLDSLRVRVAPDSDSVVITGCGARVDTAIEILSNLDEPPAPYAEVEVVMYILAARHDGEPGETPDALKSVVEQLEGLFGYQDFTLLDTLFLRTLDRGAGMVTGVLDGAMAASGKPAEYRLGFNRADVYERGEGYSVRLGGLEFVAAGSARIRTDVEVKQGQKAVIGKAKPDQSDEAWILVLDVKVLP